MLRQMSEVLARANFLTPQTFSIQRKAEQLTQRHVMPIRQVTLVYVQRFLFTKIMDLVWNLNTNYAIIVASEILGVDLHRHNIINDLRHHLRFRAYDENSFMLLFKTLVNS